MFPELFRDDVFRIETRRLWLRWPSARDEAAIERLAGAGDVADMTASVPHPYPQDGAGSFIYAARVGNAQGSALTFALAPLARPSDAIGTIAVRNEDGVPTLGYWLGRPHWGRGLMSEAVDALMVAVFRFAAVAQVTAHPRLENAASRRVLEKCGFSQVGEREVMAPARGRSFACAVYERARDATPPRWARRVEPRLDAR